MSLRGHGAYVRFIMNKPILDLFIFSIQIAHGLCYFKAIFSVDFGIAEHYAHYDNNIFNFIKFKLIIGSLYSIMPYRYTQFGRKRLIEHPSNKLIFAFIYFSCRRRFIWSFSCDFWSWRGRHCWISRRRCRKSEARWSCRCHIYLNTILNIHIYLKGDSMFHSSVS